ncbi:hypothetical protein MEX01_52270 [Methylorubrum extorquens]|nr:hypothetical protein MEX01_52270 [Methylorubrum extorquens]
MFVAKSDIPRCTHMPETLLDRWHRENPAAQRAPSILHQCVSGAIRGALLGIALLIALWLIYWAGLI